jgi:predicted Fe-Mo cluster-binding NifX family protein
MENVAMPILDEALAPCFEVARYFMICDISNPDEITTSIEKCSGCEGFGRVRFLQDNNVSILICNGIKSFYRDMLIAAGIKVVSNICLPAKEALNSLLASKLNYDESTVVQGPVLSPIPRDDLICWARDLFDSNGYRISTADKHFHSLIDFVAEINCPACGKPIRVAVCCGAHTYSYSQEIKHFHFLTSSNYQARVYIYTSNSELIQTCREYNVELIDPESDEILPSKQSTGKIPILREPIKGHEKAFGSFNGLAEDNKKMQ